MERARRAAALAGGSVRETSDRAEALAGAHVLYAKEWGATDALRRCRGGCAPARGAPRLVRARDWFEQRRRECRFMHCLPVRRNIAIADEVLDGPRSVVLREAYNRLAVQMAVLHRMLSS